VVDLVSLLHLTGRDPFQPQDPAGTLAFIQIARTVRDSGFSIAALAYLYRHEIRPTRTPAPVASRVAATLAAVRAALLAVHTDLGADDVDDPDGDDLRAKLGFAFSEEVVTQAMGIILGEPDHVPADPAGFLQDHFAAFAHPTAAAAALLPLPLSAEQRQQHIAWVRERLLPWLRDTRSRGGVAAVLAGAVGLDPALVRHLLEQRLTARVGAGAMMDDLLALAALDPDQEPEPGYVEDYQVLHKAAQVIDGFRLSGREVGHLLDHAADFAGFTLDGLLPPLLPVDDASAAALFASWERVRDLVELRDGLPSGELTLVDLFDAKVPPGADPVAHLTGVLVELTGWDQDAVGDLVAELGLQEADVRTEVAIRTLRDCLDVARRTGVGVATLVDWATTYPDGPRARAVVQAVKARYDEQRWWGVARTLNDQLREAQRDALVAFLVPRVGAEVTTADHLYEHFLIDVGMQSCMATSRIKQAISSVHQFVQRCLLGLEPAVEPEDIDGVQWKWRKNYRVWEANRKVFLYPENWIEPELRPGKSPFFRQLETDLLQDELTDDAVEQALLSYLHRLDEVARLDVRGMYWQEEPAPSGGGKKIDLLHVIARTPNSPYRYFYRRFENKREWTPWEPVDLDIQSDHPILAVYNRRLHLFWPTFTEKPKPVAQQNLDSKSPPVMRWEVALSWSEYRQGTWSAAHNSGAVPVPPEITVLEPASRYALYLDRLDSRLVLSVGALGDPDAGPNPAFAVNVTRLASFVLDGCHTSLEAAKAFDGDGLPLTRLFTFPKWADTLTSTFASWHRMPTVSLVVENGASTSGRPILGQTPNGSRLVRSPDLLEAKQLYPFFFADSQGAYFAYPVPAGTAFLEKAPDPYSVVIVTDFLQGGIDV
jgi:hypothetical protein